MSKKKDIDWKNIESSDDPQTEFSTDQIIHHIGKEEPSEIFSSAFKTEISSTKISEIFEKRNQDCVRIPIHRSIYNRILQAKRKYKSRISIPEFVEMILTDILKQNDL